MPFTLRAISTGKLLKQVFSLYGSHFFLFLGISAIPNLILLLLQLGFDQLPAVRPHQSDTAHILAAIGVSLASLFASSVVTAATTIAVSDIYVDSLPDLWDSFARLSGKALRVLLAALLVELFVGLGTLFCIVPGIYFTGIYGLAIPVVTLENLGPKKALDRSEQLATHASFRIIAIFFLTSILTGVLVTLLSAEAGYLGWTSPAAHALLSKHLLNLIAATIGGIFFGPISAIALALEYFDLRVRFENFDVQQLQALMMSPEAAPATSYADINH